MVEAQEAPEIQEIQGIQEITEMNVHGEMQDEAEVEVVLEVGKEKS